MSRVRCFIVVFSSSHSNYGDELRCVVIESVASAHNGVVLIDLEVFASQILSVDLEK